jgi:hypothetical protein
MHSRKKMIITVKTVVATAALLAALVPGAGVAHADTVKMPCRRRRRVVV